MRLTSVLAAAVLLAAAGPAFAGKQADAEAAFAQNRDEDAIRLYSEVIAETQTDPAAQASAYFGRGEVHAMTGKWEASVADFTAAIALPQDDAGRANAYFSRGEQLSRRRQWDAAIADYDQALKLSPKMPGLHFARGRALGSVKRNDEALKEYEAELEINPNSFRAKSMRAELLGLPLPVENHPHH